jgi:hypothetical protein
MLDSVEGVKSRSGCTVDNQVDRHDGVAIPINMCKLIGTGSIHHCIGIIGCNRAQIVVEVRARWAKYSTPKFHRETLPHPSEQKMSAGCVDSYGRKPREERRATSYDP